MVVLRHHNSSSNRSNTEGSGGVIIDVGVVTAGDLIGDIVVAAIVVVT